MYKKRLLWHLYPSYLFVTLAFLVAATILASGWLKDFYLQSTLADQKVRTALIRDIISEDLYRGDYSRLDSTCKRLGAESAMRITVILPDGRVAADTNEDPARMENHADRPEFIAAIGSGEGLSRRKSPTLGREMMYYALPVKSGEAAAGVVRTSLFMGELDVALGRLYTRVALGGMALAVLVAVLGLMASRRVGRVLSELEKGAERFASGELEGRLAVPEYEEMARLTHAMNQMAGELHERIRTITRQRNEQEAILSSMFEGVIAVDTAGRIMGVNQAAAALLKLDPAGVNGRDIHAAVRNTEIAVFVMDILAGHGPYEREMAIRGNEEVYIQAHGAPMQDEKGGKLGAVLVLSDVTRLKKLERVRRDFVANVSHELRTPITAIMGFAELLQGGGITDPAETARYAEIIMKQADRLNGIISDLMSLSVIERKAEKEGIPLEEGDLSAVVGSAAQTCAIAAREKDITVNLSCADGTAAMINHQLLEQAVVNLIDNAIKYSEPGSPVDVVCGTDDAGAFIEVRDRGCGIEEKHFPRLFERFYRVDKSRSRKVGGTGLGLAIVKHIVQAHGGDIGVKSYPGEGSTFTIRLKRPGTGQNKAS